MEFSRTVEIEKIDPEHHIVWGWAYVTKQAGQRVIDHSRQSAESQEIQKAAHAFVMESRTGSEIHRTKAGTIVDSIFFTKELQDALGIDLGREGWFIGMRIDAPSAWEGVQSGRYKKFSIAGSALLQPTQAEA